MSYEQLALRGLLCVFSQLSMIIVLRSEVSNILHHNKMQDDHMSLINGLGVSGAGIAGLIVPFLGKTPGL